MMAAVDRSSRINSYRYARKNPERVVVQVSGEHCPPRFPASEPFLIYRGFRRIGACATHAEAMRIAQTLARTAP